MEVVAGKIGGALKASQNFWLAAIGGGFAGTCMYPIDTAKTRMQSCASLEAAIPFAQRSYRNTLQTLGKVVSEEGFPTLYRGLIPVLVGSAPEMAVQVAAYEWARDRIGQGKDKMDLSVHFLAGCVSGFTHVAASNPMEVLKIRGQVLGAEGGGIAGAIKDVGFRGLYKGVGGCWARDIPFSAIYFPVYAYTKDQLEKSGADKFLCSLGAGLVAGVAAAAPTTPFDVIKTRLQNPKTASQYKGVIDCVKQMAAKEGPGSFFVGVGPRVGRVAPYLAISLATYEAMKSLVEHLEQNPPKMPWDKKVEEKKKGFF